MNRRTLCILLVLVACFSIAFASTASDKEKEEMEKDRKEAEEKERIRNGLHKGEGAKDAAKPGGSADLNPPEKNEKKPDESATPAKGAAVTDSFFTIGALTMAAIYIA